LFSQAWAQGKSRIKGMTVKLWLQYSVIIAALGGITAAAFYFFPHKQVSWISTCLLVIFLFIRYAIFLPRREYRDIRNRFITARTSLQSDFQAEVDNLLSLIGDRSVKQKYRNAYIELID
jgi:hypothetical protein